MIGEIVTHNRYGRGVVTAFEPPRIDIRFDGEETSRRFAWPSAAARFLTFERPDAEEAARLAVATAELTLQEQLAIRAREARRREEQLSALREESLRQKRTAAAKKAAANRAIRAARSAHTAADGK